MQLLQNMNQSKTKNEINATDYKFFGAMTILEHQKKVLQNVCFDNELFRKELYKCLAWLEKEEIEELVEWLQSNYWDTNSKEIIAVFRIYMIKKVDTFYYQKIEK